MPVPETLVCLPETDHVVQYVVPFRVRPEERCVGELGVQFVGQVLHGETEAMFGAPGFMQSHTAAQGMYGERREKIPYWVWPIEYHILLITVMPQ